MNVLTKHLVEMEGTVIQALPNAVFSINLDNHFTALGYVSGRLRQHHIKILPGDRVKVELSPYDLTRGRIIYRIPVGMAATTQGSEIRANQDSVTY